MPFYNGWQHVVASHVHIYNFWQPSIYLRSELCSLLCPCACRHQFIILIITFLFHLPEQLRCCIRLQISSQCASLKESLNSVGTEYESAKFEVETLKEKVSTLESVLKVSEIWRSFALNFRHVWCLRVGVNMILVYASDLVAYGRRTWCFPLRPQHAYTYLYEE